MEKMRREALFLTSPYYHQQKQPEQHKGGEAGKVLGRYNQLQLCHGSFQHTVFQFHVVTVRGNYSNFFFFAVLQSSQPQALIKGCLESISTL